MFIIFLLILFYIYKTTNYCPLAGFSVLPHKYIFIYVYISIGYMKLEPSLLKLTSKHIEWLRQHAV